ncbi:MAG TPA: NUDIX hydrolase, partial [Mycobacterium sp.]|nr:NUDIX hydrolase [Mycobacterium sp.]
RDMPIHWMSLAAARDAVLAGRLHNPLGAMGILAAAAVLLDGISAGLRPTQARWLRARRHEHPPA